MPKSQRLEIKIKSRDLKSQEANEIATRTREKKKSIPAPVPPPFFLKRPRNGEEMAGTDEFAFFRCRSICTGGGSGIRPKKHRKMPSGQYRYQNLLFQRIASKSVENGDSFCNPNPHIQGKNMNKNMAPKLPNLPCFKAFGVMFCPDVCSYFCLVCGGGGH